MNRCCCATANIGPPTVVNRTGWHGMALQRRVEEASTASYQKGLDVLIAEAQCERSWNRSTLHCTAQHVATQRNRASSRALLQHRYLERLCFGEADAESDSAGTTRVSQHAAWMDSMQRAMRLPYTGAGRWQWPEPAARQR
jgi:hypothetical protein